MAIEFNGSKKDREMEALDLLLKGKSDDYKGRVLEYVRNAKVDANDSTFILMAALGNLDVALVDLPKEIEKGQKNLREEIERITNEFHAIYQTVRQESQTQTEAVKTGLHNLQAKIDAVETAAKKLQKQIEAVEGAERRIKNQADEISIAIGKNTQELSNGWKKIEERDLVVLWDFNNWRAQHWLFAIGTSVIITVVAIDSWRTHSKLNQVMEELRSTNEKIADMSEKVGYNTTKLGRIEKYLGIKRTK